MAKRFLRVVPFLIAVAVIVFFLSESDPRQHHQYEVTSQETDLVVKQPAELPVDELVSQESTAEDAEQIQSFCHSIPVLPGVEGFETSSCGAGKWNEILERENRDSIWAAAMESRIRQVTQANEELRFSRVEVVCRTTACGLLLVLAEDLRDKFVPGELARIMVEQAADSLGFEESRTLRWISDDDTMFSLALLEYAEGREEYWPEPVEPERIQALPGVPGYEVVEEAVLGLNFPTAAELLAAESVNSEWAMRMEASILSEIGSVGIPLSQLHVVCRSTRCGVVLDYPAGLDAEEREAAVSGLQDRMKASLGVNSCANNIRPMNPDYRVLYFEERSDSACSLDLRVPAGL